MGNKYLLVISVLEFMSGMDFCDIIILVELILWFIS